MTFRHQIYQTFRWHWQLYSHAWMWHYIQITLFTVIIQVFISPSIFVQEYHVNLFIEPLYSPSYTVGITSWFKNLKLRYFVLKGEKKIVRTPLPIKHPSVVLEKFLGDNTYVGKRYRACVRKDNCYKSSFMPLPVNNSYCTAHLPMFPIRMRRHLAQLFFISSFASFRLIHVKRKEWPLI